ncbi:MAG: MFS transporter [Candidatus Aenigmatarchaeota archaeon]|nr:MFS transporter [Candidatus Aenigmarchaeota archaeon]
MEEIGYSQIVKKNVENSVKEGALHSVKLGAGESYINAFAIKVLNFTNTQIGLLTSLPLFLGYFSNIFTSKIIDKLNSRKKLIVIGAFINALCFIPIFLSFFIKGYEFPFMLASVTLYFVSDLIVTPAWISLMGDIIPDRIKPIFFGERNKINNLVAFCFMLISGIILHNVSGISQIYAFGIIFFIAFLAKLGSFFMHTKIYEPNYVSDEFEKFSIGDFIKKLKYTKFGIFVIYMCVFTFSFRIAAPFFSVYMFRDLNFTYWQFAIITTGNAIATIISMPWWGKYIDEYGNKKIMSLTGLLIPFIPFLWMLSENIVYLFIVEIFSGFVWAGFNLSTFNFVFYSTSSEKRARAYSYYNILIGFSIISGTMFGTWLLKFGYFFKSEIFIVFIVSSIARLITSLYFLPKIKEPPKKEISTIKLFWQVSFVEARRSLHNISIFKRKPKKRSFFERLVEQVNEIESAGGRI